MNLNNFASTLTDVVLSKAYQHNRSLLSSFMNLLRTVMRRCPSVESKKLSELFETLTKIFTTSSMRLSDSMKSSAFLLLAELARKLDKCAAIIEKLEGLNTERRTELASDWNITCESVESGSKNFVGLANMGATCYVNSVLQQLFMIPEFCRRILELNINSSPGNVLYELQHIFGVLHQKKTPVYICLDFYRSMDINVSVQKDASEFMISLFDKLSTELKNTERKTLVEDVFEIRTETVVKCEKCEVLSKVPATSFFLELEVKGKNRMIEGLEANLKSEILQDDNAYYCERCKSKVKAEKREIIKSLPNILLVHLKRFELINITNGRKINTFFEFPQKIDLQKYTSMASQSFEASCDNYFHYDLKGVIVHIGTVNAGHYYSLIRDNATDQWLKFNDSLIDDFDMHMLKDETFGNSSGSLAQDTNSAYILIYQRTTLLPKEVSAAFENGTVTSKMLLNIPHDTEPPILSKALCDKLREEEKGGMEYNPIFSSSYAKFALYIITDYLNNKKVEEKYMKRCKEFSVQYLLTVLLRTRLETEVFEFAKLVEEECKEDEATAREVVELFCNTKILREFFLDCPKERPRKCLLEILTLAIIRIHKIEEKNIEDYLEDSTKEPPLLLRLLDTVMQEIKKVNLNMAGQYFGLLAQFVKLNTYKFLMVYPLLEILLECLDIIRSKECRESMVMKRVTSDWSKPGIIPASDKCKPIEDKEKTKTQFASQAPYLIELTTELIRRGFGSNDLDILAKEQTLDRLEEAASSSRKGQTAFGELMLLMTEVEKGKYAETIVSLVLSKVRDCSNKLLHTYLRVFEVILTTSNPDLFSKAFKKFAEEVVSEIKSYNGKYFVTVSYIDSLFNIIIYNKNSVLVPENDRGKIIEHVANWLQENETVSKSTKLFRKCYNWTKDIDQTLIAASKKANIRRIETMAKALSNDSASPNTVLSFRESVKVLDNIDVYSYLSHSPSRKKGRKWVRGKVVERCRLGLKVRDEQGEEFWTEADEDEAAAEGAVVDNPIVKERDILFAILSTDNS